MVSRIGFFLQIIPLALFGGDYYFTYSLFSNNLVVSFEKLQVSKKMTATDTKPVLFFEIQNDKKALNEKEFVSIYKDEIIELILKNRASIKSVSKIDSANLTEHSIIRTLPTLINIDFKEDFGIIGIYEQTL
jgi:hypothetical protein